MDLKEALSIVSRQGPCPHDSHNSLGPIWVKCEDCGATVDRTSLLRAQASSKKFDDALTYIRSLEPKKPETPPPPVPPEELRICIYTCLGHQRTTEVFKISDWGMPIPEVGDVVPGERGGSYAVKSRQFDPATKERPWPVIHLKAEWL